MIRQINSKVKSYEVEFINYGIFKSWSVSILGYLNCEKLHNI